MALYDIIIPTCKSHKEIEPQVKAIQETVSKDIQIIVTGFKISAAANRNYGLQQAKAPYVVMLDDDITGFSPGWSEYLIRTVQKFTAAMVSARLINSDGSCALMMNIIPFLADPYQVVDGYLPSACIAFRNDGTRFDENFEGSGWEDTDFCDSLHTKYPRGKFIIDNSVQLIHANEMKNGNAQMFERNKKYYMRKHRS
jgi:glycosyltransferase involved in cell wall biosynthesis